MKNAILKKILPHVGAILIFIIISSLFCKPVLDGYVLNQHDNVSWKAMAQSAFEYKEKYGKFPLWNTHLFSGMPNYQIAMEGKSILPDMLKWFTLWLPKPISYFFLACICFYILCLTLGINYFVSLLGSIAYAFSTYNAVILAAGHDTQMLATGLMPLVIAGVLNIYQKKYWLGLAITTFGLYHQIAVNHLQVTYYLALILIILTIAFVIHWIKNKEWRHLFISGILATLAAITSVSGSALTLLTTAEYSKFTMRGGKDVEISGDTVKAVKTKGLDTEYAFEYSVGPGETVTYVMPNAYGGYSGRTASAESKTANKLIQLGIPDTNAEQLAQSLPLYWGKLYTSGPAYLGVVVSLLGLLGFFFLKNQLRWALLAATVTGIFMSWGKYFPEFNNFLFQHLPLYNKFRSPAFAQVIPQVAVTISAVLTLQQFLFGEPLRQSDFKKILYISGGFFAFLFLLYLTAGYSGPYDRDIAENISRQAQDESIGKAVIAGLKADRKALYGSQLLRAVILALITIGILYFYQKEKLKAQIAALLFTLLSSAEILTASHLYFSNEKGPYSNRQDQLFVPADEYAQMNFAKTEIDEQILKDTTPHFRVFNLAGTALGSTFNDARTSYYHRSVGGYHPAKLRIYQDIIEKYLSGTPSMQVLNMLNTKYLIIPDQQTGQPKLQINPDAYGPCWLVKYVEQVNNKVEALQKTGKTNLKDTAIVEKSCASSITQPSKDTSSFIRLLRYSNDTIDYEAFCNGNQFAVFSDIYYPKGWNVYLNGKKANYCNVNYILRGMPLPAGKHQIRFIFEPESVKQGNQMMFIASIFILLFTAGGLILHFRKKWMSPVSRENRKS